MSDHQKLREAIRRAREAQSYKDHAPRTIDGPMLAADLLILADAAESTLPKTKMEKRWHLCGARRYENNLWLPFVEIYYAKERAEQDIISRTGLDFFAFMHITGPHMQEVPA